MKKTLVIGFAAGILAGIASAVAVKKISDEIKSKTLEENFVFHNGENFVDVSCGYFESAKGLALVTIKASSESKDDVCTIKIPAKRSEDFINCDWSDKDHCKILIGGGKHKQCCDISFDEEEITARYYPMKAEIKICAKKPFRNKV